MESFNLNLLMKFGTYVYDTTNIGDEIQSIANIQYLPRIDYFIERDNPMKHRFLPNITIIANGWYTWNTYWRMPPNIHPIFVSFHGSFRFPYNKTREYMKKMGPIGCRDWSTVAQFKAVGVDAYFSGCITTTMQNIYNNPRKNIIYLADVADRSVIPDRILDIGKKRWHGCTVEYRRKFEWKLGRAALWIDDYAAAKLVITTRIHAALPSLGMNTPVIFVAPPQKTFTSFEGSFKADSR
jgi:hypothetical protein